MDDAAINLDGRVTRILLSYDVSGPLRPKAARVCQIVFGYEQTVQRKGASRTYRHPGYLERPARVGWARASSCCGPKTPGSWNGTWGASVCGPGRPGSGSAPPRPRRSCAPREADRAARSKHV